MVSDNVASDAGTHAPSPRAWVVFVCEARRFGVPLESVSEILTPRPFTRLPGTGPEVCGLVSVRGRVTTVFDLGEVLGVGPAGSLPDHRLLLLDAESRRFGVAVDKVVDIAPARLERDEAAAGVVVGTGEAEGGRFEAVDAVALARRLLPG